MPGEASLAYASSMADTISRKGPRKLQPGPLLPRWTLGTPVQPNVPFLIRKDSAFQNGSAAAYGSAVPPSCLEALHFLDRFCLGRNIADQSQAALAAVLLMLSHRTAKGLQLPAFAAGSQSSAFSLGRRNHPRASRRDS
ncbi:hypothetical protein B0T18DRAFT_413221, partial [Schizothecium vesticola]